MDEQEEFFSLSQKRLLSIAVWAKYLAWIVLVAYIFLAIATFVQRQNVLLYCSIVGNAPYSNFREVLRQTPSYGISILIEVVGVFLKGIVCFFVLKGISLGLNMIVETNVNYQEQGGAG